MFPTKILPQKILHIVCPNGLGHFKRTTEVWSKILPGLDVDVVILCESWQVEGSKHTPAVQQLRKWSNIRFESMDMLGALRWYDNPLEYNAEQYKSFLKRVRNLPAFFSANLVISDNLIGPLKGLDNAILIGSFHWHNIIDSFLVNGAQRAIIDYELSVLAQKKPPLSVYISEVAMPSVKEVPNGQPVNWLVDDVYQRKAIERRDQINVLVSIGMSGAKGVQVDEVVKRFDEDGRFIVWATTAVIDSFRGRISEKVKAFDFSIDHFKLMDLAIIRPGVGSITESIKFQIPILAANQGDNPEMHHNTNVITSLGIGVEYSTGLGLDSLQENLGCYVDCLSKRPTDGFKQIQEIIKSRL